MDVERVLEDSENDVKNLSIDLENQNKCLSVEDFPCSHFDGTMDLDATRVDQELNSKFEFSDDMLHIEQEHLNVTPLLGDCCEYLMDMSFAGSAAHLGYDYQIYGSENLGSESQCRSPLKDNDDAGSSGETGTMMSLPEARREQNQQPVDNVTIHDLHEAFHFTFGRDTTMKDKFWLKRQLSHGLHDLSQFDSTSRILDKQQPSSGHTRGLMSSRMLDPLSFKYVEQRRRHTSVSIPASILMRVRELAAHPKGQQSVSFQHAPPSSVFSLPGKKTLMSRGGKTV